MWLAFLSFVSIPHFYGMTREWLRNNGKSGLGNIFAKNVSHYTILSTLIASRHWNCLNHSYKNSTTMGWYQLPIFDRIHFSIAWRWCQKIWRGKKHENEMNENNKNYDNAVNVCAFFICFFFPRKTLHKTWFANNKSVNKTPARICNSEFLCFVFFCCWWCCYCCQIWNSNSQWH